LPRVGGSAGRILDDGSIDLRDRNLISVVQDGELLGNLDHFSLELHRCGHQVEYCPKNLSKTPTTYFICPPPYIDHDDRRDPRNL